MKQKQVRIQLLEVSLGGNRSIMDHFTIFLVYDEGSQTRDHKV